MMNYDRLKIQFPLCLCTDINKELFKNIIEGNYCVSKNILDELIGVNSIQLNCDKDLFIFDITGAFNAEKRSLGLINQNNILTVLEKVKNLRFVDFNPKEVIEHAKVFLCDITQDITVNSNIETILLDLKEKLQINSEKYYIKKYENSGISVAPIAKSKKENLIIYPKYHQLRKAKQKQLREIIGYEYLSQCKNILRFELQLKSYKEIRHYFKLEKNQEIMLKDLLMSSENPLITKLVELGIREDNMDE